MAARASIACMLAHAAIRSNALSIGDTDGVLDTNPKHKEFHKAVVEKSLEQGGCPKNTGGTCRWIDCYPERGHADCDSIGNGGGLGASYNCLCEEGYCAGGSLPQSPSTKLCLQTCKEYSKKHPCSDEEINEPEDTLCADIKCKKTECCIPKDTCQEGDCDPNTMVPLQGAKMCTGAECTDQECCVPRGKCADFECPGNTVPMNASKTDNILCKTEHCYATECCKTAYVPMEIEDNFTKNHYG